MRSKVAGCMVLGVLSGCGSSGAEVGRGDRPARPRMNDNGRDTGSLALRLTDVGGWNPATDYGAIGRNLDGFETTVGSSDRQCVSTLGPPVDGVDGIDNAMGPQVANILSLVVPCLEGEVHSAQRAGQGTLLLLLDGWNGTRNDARVTASLLFAADATSADPSAVMWDATTHQLVLSADGVTPAPEPSGADSDYVVVRPDSFTEGAAATPRILDQDAYVSDGVIVFELPGRVAIPLAAERFTLTLLVTDGLFLATLGEDLSSVTGGSLSGRVAVVDLLESLGGLGVCMSLWPSVAPQLENSADVLSDAALPASQSMCDAISFGLPIQGTALTLTREDGLPVRAGSNPPRANACAAPPVDPICD